jgi:molecular chaperone GrpE (heat shock protein)
MSDENQLPVVEEEPAAPEAGTDRAAALRALRSLEATEARVERNAKRETDEAKGKLVMELLPVLDNLDRTLHASQQHRGDPALLEGVRMVRAQLESVLLRYGVEKIDATGQRFDPALHEAIGVAPVADPRASGLVTQQHEAGYQFAGRLLRPAKVQVGKYTPPSSRLTRPSFY